MYIDRQIDRQLQLHYTTLQVQLQLHHHYNFNFNYTSTTRTTATTTATTSTTRQLQLQPPLHFLQLQLQVQVPLQLQLRPQLQLQQLLQPHYSCNRNCSCNCSCYYNHNYNHNFSYATTTLQLQLQLQLHYSNNNYHHTTLQVQLQLLHYTTLHPGVVSEVTTAAIATTPKSTTPTTFRSISGFALPPMHHNNSLLLQPPILETSATALCGTTCRRKFGSQTSDNMDRWKAEQGRGREKRKIRREKSRREKVRRKKMEMRETVGKSRFAVFFQWFVAPEGRKVGSLKRRVRSQLAKMRDEKLHAVVARSTFPSQNVKSTRGADHFWHLRCRKSARRCGAKHSSKWKCTKHTSFGPLLEVEMSKKCTPLWREVV